MPDHWFSVRLHAAHIGERFAISDDEEVINAYPGVGSMLTVVIRAPRETPLKYAGQGERTTEGEKAVTEEVSTT